RVGQGRGHRLSPPRQPALVSHGLWASGELAAGAGLPARLDWRFDVAGIEQARALALHSPSGGVMLFAAMGDGLGGGAWEVPGKAPEAGLFRPCRETNPSVDAAWRAPRVVARTVEGGSGGAVSVDGGASWTDFGAQQLVKDARGGHVAVSARGGAIVWSPPRQPALVSHDRGRTWTVCKGWPDAREVDLVPVAEKNVEGVFYVLDIVQGQVLVSVDAGRSFAPSLTGLPSLNPSWQRGVLVSAPGKLRDLWIGLPDALVNVGGVEAGARTVRNVAAAHHIALGAAAPGAAYPSLYLVGRVLIAGRPLDGLFRSDDAGASFQPLFDDRHRFGAVLSLAADPLEYGTVYLASQGRGVFVGRPGQTS
ncbi:MAG TPA: hypothetical protein VK195_20470, partial [Burkholderiaceae bacterium]|nr:hypothetical protein [Burkholderiaceae bacterium]